MLCMNSADELTSPDLVLLFTVVTCSLSCPQALNCSVSALLCYCIVYCGSDPQQKKKNENEKRNNICFNNAAEFRMDIQFCACQQHQLGLYCNYVKHNRTGSLRCTIIYRIIQEADLVHYCYEFK